MRPSPQPDPAPAADRDTWTLVLPGVVLPGPNKLMRMTSWEYRRFRNDLYVRARAGLDRDLPPAPLARCRVRVEMTRPRRTFLDVDGKYGAVKPLLDVLQPDRPYSRPMGKLRVKDVSPGLGLIAGDTDGEDGADGCICLLRVVQRAGEAELRVVVELEP